MTRRRVASALVTVTALLLGTAACADDAAPGAAAARDSWADRGPTSYSFRLEASCGERALMGAYAVTVTDGVVSTVEPLDEAAELSLPAAQQYVPTIAELLERVADLPADRVREADFDDDGVPTHVFIDNEPASIDDEECYDIADVRPMG